jgi:predicted HAD superfamily phosphohydrolase YqeG
MSNDTTKDDAARDEHVREALTELFGDAIERQRIALARVAMVADIVLTDSCCFTGNANDCFDVRVNNARTYRISITPVQS